MGNGSLLASGMPVQPWPVAVGGAFGRTWPCRCPAEPSQACEATGMASRCPVCSLEGPLSQELCGRGGTVTAPRWADGHGSLAPSGVQGANENSVCQQETQRHGWPGGQTPCGKGPEPGPGDRSDGCCDPWAPRGSDRDGPRPRTRLCRCSGHHERTCTEGTAPISMPSVVSSDQGPDLTPRPQLWAERSPG